MTCIVGIADQGKVYIGGDSMISDSDSGWYNTVCQKVFIREAGNSTFIYGGSGLPRLDDIMLYEFNPPVFDTTKSVDAYIHGDFTRELIAVCKRVEFASKKNEMIRVPHSGMLLGFHGRLYQWSVDFAFMTTPSWGAAEGQGGQPAAAILYSLYGQILDPTARCMQALEASEAVTCSVRRPFTVLSL